MERDTEYEARKRIIVMYEEAIDYYKKNLLKHTEHGTWITPRLIRSFESRVDELKAKL
tara:strand:+ start:91 stop:264 length:174 start_codon:yes stop_codon:yes gene_type:complete